MRQLQRARTRSSCRRPSEEVPQPLVVTPPAGAATADAALLLEQIGALLDEIDQDDV